MDLSTQQGWQNMPCSRGFHMTHRCLVSLTALAAMIALAPLAQERAAGQGLPGAKAQTHSTMVRA